MPRYPLVIFDFDGTLADSIGWLEDAYDEVARRHRLRTLTPAEFKLLRGCDTRTILRHIGVPPWKLPLLALEVRRLYAASADAIAPFPGVPAMLDDLAAAGVDLAVVSSNDEHNVRRILGPAAAPIRRFLCGAGLFGKAAAFRRIRRGSGLRGQHILSIGDEVRDIEAARRTGLHTAAATWGFATPARLAAAAPTLTFRSIAEVAPALTSRTPREAVGY
jgi:phosphoglycolate phosphatase